MPSVIVYFASLDLQKIKGKDSRLSTDSASVELDRFMCKTQNSATQKLTTKALHTYVERN